MALGIRRWNHPLLTDVQNEIVPSLCDDCLSTKEVAEKHCISVNTVASHKKNIFSTLKISKITELSKMFFTLVVLAAIFGFHGIIESQARSRIIYNQRYISSSTRGRTRTRRRERSIPIKLLDNQNTNIS